MSYFYDVPNDTIAQCKDCKALYTHDNLLPSADPEEPKRCPKCGGSMEPAFKPVKREPVT